jgi:DNA topoisomerase-2
MLNVRDVSADKFAKNEELTAIKKILGLEQSKVYKDLKSLRYGRVMVMADQDLDGSHIKGLLMNLFHAEWPALMQAGFICSLATPLLKATKRGETISFHSAAEFEAWKTSNSTSGWHLKYYKGLGTSTDEEAKEWFEKLKEIKYTWDAETDESMSMAFSKKRADDRKTWLQSYDKTALVPAGLHVPYTDFIHKDLIHFSNYNLERAIPSMMDGLKVSQRKILYAAFKRNLTTEIRVAQFAGYVSEHSGYHHGEASLNEAIIGMAQDFMGANNLPWLVPQGQFGTRIQGGKDSASPRYIHTFLQSVVKKLVPSEDFPVLTYRDDDGLPVEPQCYVPVLPMLLVNGSRGIGTGYSTSIPGYNPKELKDMLVAWLKGQADALDRPLKPYFKGFKGTVADDGTLQGLYTKQKDEFIVTELPPGTWTQDYRIWLEKELAEGKVKDFVDSSTDTDIHIRIKGIDEAVLVKSLTDKVKTTNMHAFNSKGIIAKYDTPNEILKEFASVRLALYETRRQHQLKALQDEMPYHVNVVKFIEDQVKDTPTLVLKKKTRAECDTMFKQAGYTSIDGYDYLLKLPVSSFTAEQIAKHEAQLAALRAEHVRLESLRPAEMWLMELAVV